MRHASLVPLSHDHHHALALALRCRKQALGRLKPMGAEGLKARAEEFKEFFNTKLKRHFNAEEQILFPFLRAATPESNGLIDELLKEHEQIRRTALTMEAGKDRARILFDLGDLLERHIRREERELFDLFESRIPAARTEALKTAIEKVLSAED
jgi:hemerythrin-like domain-containing protein